jgi:ribulose 1,5-bisphosphate carboxylase large subunit-like protein
MNVNVRVFMCVSCGGIEPVPPDASLADLGRARLCDCGGLMQIGAHRDPAAGVKAKRRVLSTWYRHKFANTSGLPPEKEYKSASFD